MKITRNQLRRIINEELRKSLAESPHRPHGVQDTVDPSHGHSRLSVGEHTAIDGLSKLINVGNFDGDVAIYTRPDDQSKQIPAWVVYTREGGSWKRAAIDLIWTTNYGLMPPETMTTQGLFRLIENLDKGYPVPVNKNTMLADEGYENVTLGLFIVMVKGWITLPEDRDHRIVFIDQLGLDNEHRGLVIGGPLDGVWAAWRINNDVLSQLPECWRGKTHAAGDCEDEINVRVPGGVLGRVELQPGKEVDVDVPPGWRTEW